MDGGRALLQWRLLPQFGQRLRAEGAPGGVLWALPLVVLLDQHGADQAVNRRLEDAHHVGAAIDFSGVGMALASDRSKEGPAPAVRLVRRLPFRS